MTNKDLIWRSFDLDHNLGAPIYIADSTADCFDALYFGLDGTIDSEAFHFVLRLLISHHFFVYRRGEDMERDGERNDGS